MKHQIITLNIYVDECSVITTNPKIKKNTRGLFVWKLHYSHVHYIYHVSKINIKRLNNGGKTKKVNNKFKQEINITM
jgi:hypothetical protein